MPFCAFCYKQQAAAAPMVQCAKCNKRCYCDSACMAADWSGEGGQGHERWCGFTGEIGTDYEVRDVLGKGLGLFALRPFKRFDVILAERPMMKSPWPLFSALSAPEAAALEALCPNGEPVAQKILANQMGCALPDGDCRCAGVSLCECT